MSAISVVLDLLRRTRERDEKRRERDAAETEAKRLPPPVITSTSDEPDDGKVRIYP